MRKNVWNATFLQAQNEAKAGAFFAHTSPSLGIRNHNPLNIRYVKANKWLGLSKTTPNVSGFCKFDCVDYGLRAAILLILTYIRKRGCVTPRQIITRWAPPSENNTELYIQCVCGRAGVAPRAPIAHSRVGFQPLRGRYGAPRIGHTPHGKRHRAHSHYL